MATTARTARATRSNVTDRDTRSNVTARAGRGNVTDRAVRWLLAQQLGRRPFAGFPPRAAPPDVEAAYAVQDAFVAEKAVACGPPVGWKIALSNPAMQAFVGLDEPIAGRLHRDQVVGGPARTRAGAYVRLLVEFEIAVVLGADLPSRAAPYGRREVADAVAAVRPAFELADDRGADYAQLSAHGLQLVAGNAWNEGAVLGETRTDWRGLDLAAIRGVVRIDGEEVASGLGGALMGHPLDALAWLATHASRRGAGMRAGEVAILGSLVTSRFPVAGQRLAFELEGFAPLSLSID
jgi:2-keto-4-pentenoate hydratase